MSETLFGEHAGRTQDQARAREADDAWRRMRAGYEAMLADDPPVDYAKTQKGRRAIGGWDCARFRDGFRRAFGFDLVALVAAALRYKKAWSAHERAQEERLKRGGGVAAALLDCREERDEMFLALKALLDIVIVPEGGGGAS